MDYFCQQRDVWNFLCGISSYSIRGKKDKNNNTITKQNTSESCQVFCKVLEFFSLFNPKGNLIRNFIWH